MITESLGHPASLDELTQMLYTPGAKGTFQNDVIAATRRSGLIAVPVNKMKNILNEINNQHPILVFQNLGLTWFPKWHYAVVVGYDLNANEMILHSGESKNFRMKIPTFEKIWERVDHWGLIIVNPGTIPETASEFDMVKATAALEVSGKLDAAIKSYEKIITKWPESLGSLVGLGNIYFQREDYKKSQTWLKQAIDYHPEAAGAWHNYALALSANGKIHDARAAAKKAIELADTHSYNAYKESLKSLLTE